MAENLKPITRSTNKGGVSQQNFFTPKGKINPKSVKDTTKDQDQEGI
jgi:hypothetical protein